MCVFGKNLIMKIIVKIFMNVKIKNIYFVFNVLFNIGKNNDMISVLIFSISVEMFVVVLCVCIGNNLGSIIYRIGF